MVTNTEAPQTHTLQNDCNHSKVKRIKTDKSIPELKRKICYQYPNLFQNSKAKYITSTQVFPMAVLPVLYVRYFTRTLKKY